MKIGILGILGIAFIVLRLCHVIGWSWWWVTCPLWIGAVVTLLILFVAALIDLNGKGR
jgi:hypothetical protein